MKKLCSNKIFKTALFMALMLTVFALNKDYAKAAVSGNVTATTMVTGEEKYDSFADGVIVMDASGYSRSSVVSITTDCSGLLTIAYQGTNVEDVKLDLYSDEACTNEIGYGTSVSPSSQPVYSNDSFEVPKAGTYYLKLSSYEKIDITYSLAAEMYSADDGSLKSGVAKYVSLIGYDDENYYKITLSKSGVVDVLATYADNSESYADVAIYKSESGKKKLIAERDASIDGAEFGLAKGTYYIKLYNGKSDFYSIRYKFTSLTDNSGSSKAKAKALSYGKAKKGLVLAGDKTSKADWYKFYNSKSREITLYFEGQVTGGVTLEFYGSDGDKFGSLYISKYTTNDSGSPYVSSYYSNSGKLPKGTYYIKVTKDSKDVSGYYSIKLK